MPVGELVRVPPAHLWVPPHVSTSGPDVTDLAASAGLILDGEQQLVVDSMLAETASGHWAAFEAAVVMCRQNGKTIGLQAIALFKLFFLQDRLTVWTAHEYPTAVEAFLDIQALIDRSPHLKRKVRRVSNTNGEEGIELLSGARLNFRARSKGAGRGLSGNTVILDEAFALTNAHIGSLLPTLRAVPNSQVIYASSAGHLRSAVLRAVRDRGRLGGSASLAYLEWCAPRRPCATPTCEHQYGVEGCVLDDRDGWQAGNPALGRRVAMHAMQSEREAMPVPEFMRECLGWWEDPPPETGGAIDMGTWTLLERANQHRGSRVLFGLDLAEDRSASLAVGWKRPDGGPHVMIAKTFPSTEGVVAECARVTKEWGGKVVLGGPAESLVTELKAAGVPLVVLSGREFVQGCGLVDDAVKATLPGRKLSHGNQPELNEAARVAKWRTVGASTERAWLLKDVAGIGPLVAATRVVRALGDALPPPPSPEAIPPGGDSLGATSTDFVATAGF